MLYMSKVFDDKSRRKYGLVSNFIYNLKAVKEWDNKLFWAQILVVVPYVADSLLGSYLPARLVSDLTGQVPLSQMLLTLASIALVMWLCNAAANMMIEFCYFASGFLDNYYAQKFVNKITDVDYDYLEDEEFQKISGNAWRVARFGQGVTNAVTALPIFMYSSVGVLVYGFLLARKSWILLLMLMGSLSVSLWLLSVARKKHAEN